MSTYDELSKPLPKEVEGKYPKAGKTFTFIPVSEIVARLNNVLGPGNWSFSIHKCERDPDEREYIIAHVEITTTIASKFVSKEAFGGTAINRKKGSNGSGPIEALENDYKTAVSDAFKKAASLFGVGLYLSRSEEALELEEQEQMKIDPEVEQLWGNFKSFVEKFDGDQRTELDAFWTAYSNSRPKPRLETATVEDLNALLEKCTAMSLGAEVVTT